MENTIENLKNQMELPVYGILSFGLNFKEGATIIFIIS